MTDHPVMPRRTPCASCPYRKSVPSGIWHPSEYAKLERYDAPMPEQPVAVFTCHQGDHDACAGWLGHRDPTDLLAVRLGIVAGHVDVSCAEYTTSVPLFSSGAEAAAHGTADTLDPSDAARTAIEKIVRTRQIAGSPVILDDPPAP